MVACTHIGLVATPMTYFPSHQHDVWELVVYTSGTGAITVGDVPVPFSPGTIVCLPPNIPHFETAQGGYTNIFIIFSRFTPFQPGIPTCIDDVNRSFYQIAMQLYTEFNLRQTGWKRICENLTEVLMRYLERWGSSTRVPEVERLRHLLVENLHVPGYSVGDAMADLAGSPDQTRKLFHQATGQTPTRYLTELRIASAKRLLTAGALVKEAAEQVGLEDPYYFSRVFRRHTGMSPKQYLDSLHSDER